MTHGGNDDGERAGATPDYPPQRAPDLAALYLRHRDSMWRAAASYLRGHGIDPSAADDAISTVMARLARQMPNPAPENWEGYLIRAATNAARDEVKANARRRDRPDRDDDVSVSRADIAADVTPVDEEVATAVDRPRQAAHVRTAMDTLPPDERKAIYETLFRHRRNADVAAEMGISAARVSQLKSAGGRALVGQLENEWTHDRR